MTLKYVKKVIRKTQSLRIAKELDTKFIANISYPVGNWYPPMAKMSANKLPEYNCQIMVLKTIIFIDCLNEHKKGNDIWDDIITVLQGNLQIRIGRENAVTQLRRWDEGLANLQNAHMIENDAQKNVMLRMWAGISFGYFLVFETDGEMIGLANAWLGVTLAAPHIVLEAGTKGVTTNYTNRPNH